MNRYPISSNDGLHSGRNATSASKSFLPKNTIYPGYAASTEREEATCVSESPYFKSKKTILDETESTFEKAKKALLSDTGSAKSQRSLDQDDCTVDSPYFRAMIEDCQNNDDLDDNDSQECTKITVSPFNKEQNITKTSVSAFTKFDDLDLDDFDDLDDLDDLENVGSNTATVKTPSWIPEELRSLQDEFDEENACGESTQITASPLEQQAQPNPSPDASFVLEESFWVSNPNAPKKNGSSPSKRRISNGPSLDDLLNDIDAIDKKISQKIAQKSTNKTKVLPPSDTAPVSKKTLTSTKLLEAAKDNPELNVALSNTKQILSAQTNTELIAEQGTNTELIAAKTNTELIAEQGTNTKIDSIQPFSPDTKPITQPQNFIPDTIPIPEMQQPLPPELNTVPEAKLNVQNYIPLPDTISDRKISATKTNVLAHPTRTSFIRLAKSAEKKLVRRVFLAVISMLLITVIAIALNLSTATMLIAILAIIGIACFIVLYIRRTLISAKAIEEEQNNFGNNA